MRLYALVWRGFPGLAPVGLFRSIFRAVLNRDLMQSNKNQWKLSHIGLRICRHSGIVRPEPHSKQLCKYIITTNSAIFNFFPGIRHQQAIKGMIGSRRKWCYRPLSSYPRHFFTCIRLFHSSERKALLVGPREFCRRRDLLGKSRGIEYLRTISLSRKPDCPNCRSFLTMHSPTGSCSF